MPTYVSCGDPSVFISWVSKETTTLKREGELETNSRYMIIPKGRLINAVADDVDITQNTNSTLLTPGSLSFNLNQVRSFQSHMGFVTSILI